MRGVNPYEFPELYRLLLGSTWSPGVLTLSGHDRVQPWDVQKAKGSEGAACTLGGKDLGEFTATFYLASCTDDETGENDFTLWDRFQKIVESTVSGTKPVALPIYHPDLVRNGFTEVVCASISGMVWDAVGGASVSVKFREYKPPKPKKAKKATPKKASRVGTTEQTKPDPNAAAKKELASLLDTAKKP